VSKTCAPSARVYSSGKDGCIIKFGRVLLFPDGQLHIGTRRKAQTRNDNA
jgi:hypothetical protein